MNPRVSRLSQVVHKDSVGPLSNGLQGPPNQRRRPRHSQDVKHGRVTGEPVGEATSSHRPPESRPDRATRRNISPMTGGIWGALRARSAFCQGRTSSAARDSGSAPVTESRQCADGRRAQRGPAASFLLSGAVKCMDGLHLESDLRGQRTIRARGWISSVGTHASVKVFSLKAELGPSS